MIKVNAMFKDFFFDYIYYRLLQIDRNKENRGLFGSVVISLVQVMYSFEILIFVLKTIFEIDVSSYSRHFGYTAVVIYTVIVYLNFSKYSDKNSLFEERWRDEDPALRMKRGILIILVIAAPLIPLILITD